jgi:SAM-dependent methyltransferase
MRLEGKDRDIHDLDSHYDWGIGTTNSLSYTQRLVRIQGGLLKKVLAPINPYKWHIRRVCRGKVLDVGCGIGRNLRYLANDQNIGVDHNPDSVQICRETGLNAFTPDEFFKNYGHAKFQTLLLSHVIEHLTPEQARSMLEQYMPFMDDDSQIIIICPQQRGFASDETHVTYFEEKNIRLLLDQFELGQVSYRSFPLPKSAGNLFIYNEHVAVVHISKG